MKFIFVYLALVIVTQKIATKSLCSSSLLCDNCEICGEKSDIYSTCDYYNLFCKNSYSEKVFYKTVRDKYYNYFKNDPEIKAFCGTDNYILLSEKEEKENNLIILNTKDKTFPTNKRIHCFYAFNGKEKFEEISFTINIIKNNNNNGSNDLKFKVIGVIEKKIEELDDDNIRRGINQMKFSENIYSCEFYIDFLQIYNKPQENVEINIYYKKKE